MSSVALADRPSLVLVAEADFGSREYAAFFDASDADASRHPVWLRHFFVTLAPARRAINCTLVGRKVSGDLLFVLPLILRRLTGVRLLETADLASAITPPRSWRIRCALSWPGLPI